MRTKYIIRLLLLALVTFAIPATVPTASAGFGVGISVGIAPPPLPVYAQPICPGDGYIWTPGYWAYATSGYYWVPGIWVLPPRVGFLWTPGYWGWGGGGYFWHAGYWGPHVGFYGGVNYGFGYGGFGYQGGYWNHNHFFYNRSVNHINTTNIHNVYNRTVVNDRNVSRVSYNGGRGGINARPTSAEMAANRDHHIGATGMQSQHEHFASTDRSNTSRSAGNFSRNTGRGAESANVNRGSTARSAGTFDRNSGRENSFAHSQSNTSRQQQFNTQRNTPRNTQNSSRQFAARSSNSAPAQRNNAVRQQSSSTFRQNASRQNNSRQNTTRPAAPRAQSNPGRSASQSHSQPHAQSHANSGGSRGGASRSNDGGHGGHRSNLVIASQPPRDQTKTPRFAPRSVGFLFSIQIPKPAQKSFSIASSHALDVLPQISAVGAALRHKVLLTRPALPRYDQDSQI